jgi:SnoaL-like domain
MKNSDLAREVRRLADIHEIANLQGRYLYYVQSHRYSEIVGMFAHDDHEVSAEIAESGVYTGIEKISALFTGLIGPFFNGPGILPIHMLTTPVIEIHPGGTMAHGMWQTLGCNSFPTPTGLRAAWQQGKYDNIFVRESQGWRFKQFRWLCNFRTPFDKGWVEQPMLDVEPLQISQFPEALRPSRAGERYDAYDPSRAMDFGPEPPEPVG